MSSIPNAVMPHAMTDEPADRSPPRGAVSTLIGIAAFPGLVCLGAGMLAFAQLRQFQRGWLKSEG